MLKSTQLEEFFDINTGYLHAVQEAIEDIEQNWEHYRQRFLEGKWPR